MRGGPGLLWLGLGGAGGTRGTTRGEKPPCSSGVWNMAANIVFVSSLDVIGGFCFSFTLTKALYFFELIP